MVQGGVCLAFTGQSLIRSSSNSANASSNTHKLARYHRHCIDEWLRRSAECPICKQLLGISCCFTESISGTLRHLKTCCLDAFFSLWQVDGSQGSRLRTREMIEGVASIFVTFSLCQEMAMALTFPRTAGQLQVSCARCSGTERERR